MRATSTTGVQPRRRSRDAARASDRPPTDEAAIGRARRGEPRSSSTASFRLARSGLDDRLDVPVIGMPRLGRGGAALGARPRARGRRLARCARLADERSAAPRRAVLVARPRLRRRDQARSRRSRGSSSSPPIPGRKRRPHRPLRDDQRYERGDGARRRRGRGARTGPPGARRSRAEGRARRHGVVPPPARRPRRAPASLDPLAATRGRGGRGARDRRLRLGRQGRAGTPSAGSSSATSPRAASRRRRRRDRGDRRALGHRGAGARPAPARRSAPVKLTARVCVLPSPRRRDPGPGSARGLRRRPHRRSLGGCAPVQGLRADRRRRHVARSFRASDRARRC